jgi:hypothetical protein
MKKMLEVGQNEERVGHVGTHVLEMETSLNYMFL